MLHKLKITQLDIMIPSINLVIDRIAYTGWSVPQRTIMDQELVLILDGSGSFTVENIRYPVKPGMLFYFYPNVVHSGNTQPDSPMHFLAMHFSFAISKTTDRHPQLDTAFHILPIKTVNQLTNHHKVRKLFYEIYQTWFEKNRGYQWKQNILFQQLIYEIIFDIHKPSDNFSDIQRIGTVLDYIRKNFTETMSIDTLCSLTDLHPAHFSVIFKKVTGKTAIEYINQLRIDHSKDLLLNTSKKIKEISTLSGFNDEFYFSRVFTKHQGYSPKQYRNRFVKKSEC